MMGERDEAVQVARRSPVRVIVATGLFRSSSDARSGNAFDYGDGEYASTSRLAFVKRYSYGICPSTGVNSTS